MCKLMQTVGKKYDEYCLQKRKRDMMYTCNIRFLLFADDVFLDPILIPSRKFPTT